MTLQNSPLNKDSQIIITIKIQEGEPREDGETQELYAKTKNLL